MILLANFLLALSYLVHMALETYFWIVVGSAVVSWVNADPWNPIVRFLRSATSPVYRRLARWMPFLSAGGVDFTPLVVVALILFLQTFLAGSLHDYALALKTAL